MKTEVTETTNSLVVCGLLEEQAISHVKGSQIRNCARCDAEVWVSPSTFIRLPDLPNPEFICMPCFIKHRETAGDQEVELVAPSDHVVEELKAAGVNITADMLNKINAFISSNPAQVVEIMRSLGKE